jgi:hypothetical protein
VLPALALAFGRLFDLSHPLARSGAQYPSRPGQAWWAFSGFRGYYAWAVVGYALGLGVTLTANANGWTFNNVQGQPALLYLVPSVLGAMLLRSALHSETAALFAGTTPLALSAESGSSDGLGGSDGGMTALEGAPLGGDSALLVRRSPRSSWCCNSKDH